MSTTQITQEILDKIEKSIGICGKESGKKIYFLKNGNVANIRYSNFSYSTGKNGSYHFLISIDRFKGYNTKFKLILSCGSFENTLIIPFEDIEKLFKNINKSNKWLIYISRDLKLKDIDLSKYLNRWELLNCNVEKNVKNNIEENMDDNVRNADIRTKIYDNISKLSKENKKSNHLYLCNDLYRQGYEKYEIYNALRYLEEKDAIYKIIYVDWYINDKYKEIDLAEVEKLLLDIFTTIKNFCKRHDWMYGLKKSDLYRQLMAKGYIEDEIIKGLKFLEEEKVIRKKKFTYWFTHEYKGDIAREYEDINEVFYMPDKENIEKMIDDIKGVSKNEVKEEDKVDEEIHSNIQKFEIILIKWKDLKDEQIRIGYDVQKEIDLQKDLELKREESIKRQKVLEEKILNINTEKDVLERLINPISQYDYQKVVEEKKG